MLKEPTHSNRALIDSTIKWILNIGSEYLEKKYKNILAPRRKGEWNNKICKLGNETIYEVEYDMYKNKTQLGKLNSIADLSFSLMDEENYKLNLNHFEKFALDWKLSDIHRGAKHLIWERTERGAWNRPLVKFSWIALHESIEEVYQKKDKEQSLIKMFVDSSMIITDTDDPYYTMFKWWLCKVRDKKIFEKIKGIETNNKLFKMFLIYLRKMEKETSNLQADWNVDICKIAENSLVKKDIEINPEKRKEEKLTRRFCPL